MSQVDGPTPDGTASSPDGWPGTPSPAEPGTPSPAEPGSRAACPPAPPTPASGLGLVFDHAPDARTKVAPKTSRRRRWKIVLGSFAVLVLLLSGGAVLALRHVQSQLDQNIERFDDPFVALPSRPAVDPASADAVNILLLGSDSRVSAGDPDQWSAGAQRTDAIMVLHIPADRSGAYIISIPRDSWVTIPGHGKNKINSGFSYGGPSLMVQTVESVTGVRIDHVAIVDFDGFKQITDALGGVMITVPETTHDMRATFTAGTQLMDGETALNYVRQRYNLPGGDFDRVKRQQNWIRAVMTKLVSAGTLTNPFKLNDALQALTRSLATDEGFTIDEMQGLALSMRGVRPGAVKFITVPVKGTGWSPDHKQSIVVLDQAAGAGLWQAVRSDRVPDWLAGHKADSLGSTVR